MLVPLDTAAALPWSRATYGLRRKDAVVGFDEGELQMELMWKLMSSL
jgi:hypothetical protein